MKIGIFGDSFAYEKVLFGEFSKYKYLDQFGKPWVTHFKQNNPSWKIDNYSLPGSCFYYSYDKYLEHRDKYDKIIFVVTDHLRVSKISPPDGKPAWTAPSANAAKHKMDNSKGEERQFYKSCIDFFFYVQDPIKEERLWCMIYNDICKDDKVFSILAFKNPLEDMNYLRKIENLEDAAAGLSENVWERWDQGIVDMRYNHISGPNNIILAEEIESQIKENKKSFELNLEKYRFNKDEIAPHYVKQKFLKKYMSR